MKKFITIGVGTLMIAGAIMPFASASRDAYHAIVHNYRSFGEYQPSRDGYRVADAPQVRERFQLRNNEPYIYENDAIESLNYPYRPTTYVRGRIGNRYGHYRRGTAQRGALRVGRVPEDIAVETYEDAGFSFQMPGGAVRNANEDYIIYDLGTAIRVAIRKYDPSVCSEQQGFFACGVKISKNENRLATYGNADAITTSRIVRQTHFSDTILDSQVQTRTYSEAFSAYMNQGNEKYISRLMVADVDRSVYMIEVQSPVEAADENVAVANEVFDSFRIFPY